jgi:hypothetical protein
MEEKRRFLINGWHTGDSERDFGILSVMRTPHHLVFDMKDVAVI